MTLAWLVLMGLSLTGAYGWMAWQVWLDTSVRHQNEMGRHQKGYTYRDRERGHLYWYLRSKHKLSRQVTGLLDQQRARDEVYRDLEVNHAKLTARFKAERGHHAL